MSKKRSLYKTISWRLTASTTTILLVYLATGTFKIAGTVALLEIIVKTAIYYIHERVWEKRFNEV